MATTKTAAQNPSTTHRAGPERDDLRPAALAAERDVGAPGQVPALEGERHHRDRDEDQRQRGRQPVARRMVEQRVDPRRQRDDAPGQPDDRLRAEEGDGVDESHQGARQDRRATSGSVTPRRSASVPAPRIRADSSIEASTDCSALDASRYTNGKV